MTDPTPAAGGPFARVEQVEQTASTNTALRDAAVADPTAWPHLSVLVAQHQSAGRGRAGRTWVTQRGAALTASVLLRPHVPADRLAWLTLLSGLAVVRALAELTPQARTALKWPNDVLLLDAGPELEGWGTARKLGGILTELLPPTSPASATQPAAVVVGVGLNLAQPTDALPVPWAASLASGGLPVPGRPELLDALGRHLGDVVGQWEAHDGDATAAGLHAAVSAACASLGGQVRVELPGGTELSGRATALDDAGRLLVRDSEGQERAVVAGDVLHVRARSLDQPSGR